MLRLDLHLHTLFSGDSTIDPKLVVEQLHAHPSIKGVAITDHDSMRGYFRTRTLANTYEDLIILPGIEISTEKGDLIILGVEEEPPNRMTLVSAIEWAKAADGIIIIPHPFRSMGLGEFTDKISAHAIEVLNPTATPKENRLAKELAKARNLPGVAGTDAHDPKEMWSVFTEVEAEPTVDSVLNALRKGSVEAISASG